MAVVLSYEWRLMSCVSCAALRFCVVWWGWVSSARWRWWRRIVSPGGSEQCRCRFPHPLPSLHPPAGLTESADGCVRPPALPALSPVCRVAGRSENTPTHTHVLLMTANGTQFPVWPITQWTDLLSRILPGEVHGHFLLSHHRAGELQVHTHGYQGSWGLDHRERRSIRI